MSNENNNLKKSIIDDFSIFNNSQEGEVENLNGQNNQPQNELDNQNRQDNQPQSEFKQESQQNEIQNPYKKNIQRSNEKQNIQNELNLENGFNHKTVIIKKNKKKDNHPLYQSINLNIKNSSDKIIDPIEEERRKKENEEKNKIRNKLQCFICFGKVKNATMCPKCKGIACEDCVKKMLSKYSICSKCRERVQLKDMIKLPFMNDLTNFFIHNVENKKRNGNNEIDNNINNEPKSNNSNYKALIKVEECKYHPNKNTEYFCLNCYEYLCPECLVFFNKDNVARHSNHIILSNEEINEYDLKKILDEFKILKSKYNKLYMDNNHYRINIKEIEISKKRMNDIIDSIKEKLKEKYKKKENDLKYLMNILKSKNNDIEISMKTFKKDIEKIIEINNGEKTKSFLNNLKKLNNIPCNRKEIEQKGILQKNILCQTYESNDIDFKIPNGTYCEGLEIFNREITIIPNMKCKLNSQLISNSIVFTLIIQINDELYEKIKPQFYGHFIIFSKTVCEYAILNDYYNKGEEILSVIFEFSKMKVLLDENYKCKLKFFITETHFK